MDKLIVLHALAIQGVVDEDGLKRALDPDHDQIRQLLESLEASGLISFWESARRSGWRLTTAGLAERDSLMKDQRTPALLGPASTAYERFLQLNGPVKTLFTRWQTLGADDGAERWSCIEELDEHHAAVSLLLGDAEKVAPWLRQYPRRFEVALDQVHAGAEQFFTAPTVDSYHTIWFECHEDLLCTLGRERSDSDGV